MLLCLALANPSWRQRLRARYRCAAPKGAPPAIPPIIIIPFSYHTPAPAIDPPPAPLNPPLAPPVAPAVTRCWARLRRA